MGVSSWFADGEIVTRPVPTLAASEESDADVSANLEQVAVERYLGTVGLAGVGIIELPVVCMRDIDDGEVLAELHTADASISEVLVGIEFVDGVRVDGLDEPGAEGTGAAFIDAYDGVVPRAPIAEHSFGGAGSGRAEEHRGEDCRCKGCMRHGYL